MRRGSCAALVVLGSAGLFGCAAAPPAVENPVVVQGHAQAPSRPIIPDQDNDGVPDDIDKCIDQPEDHDGVEDDDGCPETDADHDGIVDELDACPLVQGMQNPDPQRNGCPFVRVGGPGEEIRIITVVQFAYADATTIDPSGRAVLDEIVAVLKDHPEMKKIEVQGHASSEEPGAAALSQKRAKAVVDALVARGAEAGRLVAKGYGTTQPIDDNSTKEGRAKNRRVTFLILDGSS